MVSTDRLISIAADDSFPMRVENAINALIGDVGFVALQVAYAVAYDPVTGWPTRPATGQPVTWICQTDTDPDPYDALVGDTVIRPDVYVSPIVGQYLRNDGDTGQTSGTVPDSTLSASATDDAYGSVSVGTGAALAYDNAQALPGRVTSVKLSTGATSASSFFSLTGLAGFGDTVYWRTYVYLTANPGATFYPVVFTATDATIRGRIGIKTDGHLVVLGGSSATALATSASAVPLNEWVRLEGTLVLDAGAAGSSNVDAYAGEGVSVVSGVTAAATGVTPGAATIDQVRFGIPTSVANIGPLWTAGQALSDTARVGPISTEAVDTGLRAAQTFVVGAPIPRAVSVDATPPAVPTGVGATAVDYGVTVAWTAVADTDLDHYNLYRGTASPPTTLVTAVPAGTVTFADGGRVAGTLLYYAVTAVDRVGNESAKSSIVSATPTAVVVEPPPTGAATYATLAEAASFPTSGAGYTAAQATATALKAGTLTPNLDSQDNRAGPVAMTGALAWMQGGKTDSALLAATKTYILAAPGTNAPATQALNAMRGIGGLLAAVRMLQIEGVWSSAATCPNLAGATFQSWIDGLENDTLGTGNARWPGILVTAKDSANNWGAVARYALTTLALVRNDPALLTTAVNLFKRYLGDTSVAVPFNKTASYIGSWDNTGSATGKVNAGIGFADAARPGLDGVVVDDVNRGGTGYSATGVYFGATGAGLTYPLEAAEYTWATAAVLLHGGYDVKNWSSQALLRMGDWFNRAKNGTTTNYAYAEGASGIYTNHRWLGNRFRGGVPYGTPVPTTTDLRSAPRADWVAGTGSRWLTSAATPQTVGGLQPTQPLSIVYGTPPPITTADWDAPGALLIAGRDNYDDAKFVATAAGGACVLIYVNAINDATYGTYHTLLHNASAYGADVPSWPGPVSANSTGNLADFRPGSVMHQPSLTNGAWTKLEAVLEKCVADNPHMGGFFADDLGSRSYFPNFNWDTFGGTNQSNYRDGAILVLEAFSRVCLRHNLILIVNGTWAAGTLAANGGGYPDMSVHGASLADGSMIEHHPLDAYFTGYVQGAQWGTAAYVAGEALMAVVASTDAERNAWVAAGLVSHAVRQSSAEGYDGVAPQFGAFHAIGLPNSPT